MKIRGLLTVALLALTAGCSFCESSTQIVAVNVIPRDAKVIADGKPYFGGSPMFIECKRSNELQLQVFRPGYRSVYYVIGNHLSTTGILDACGTIFVFPFIGLWTNGAWALDETNVTIRMEKLTPTETEAQLNDANDVRDAVSTSAANDDEQKATEAAAPAEAKSEAAAPAEDKSEAAAPAEAKSEAAAPAEAKAEAAAPAEAKSEAAAPAEAKSEAAAPAEAKTK